MLEFIGSALTAIIGGGATGLLGGLLSGWVELSKLKEQNRHEEKKRDQDLAVVQAEAAGKLAIAKTEGATAIELGDVQTFAQSYEHDRATYSSDAVRGLRGWFGQVGRLGLVLVDVARGFIRPTLTVYFAGLSTFLTIVAVDLLQQLEPGAAHAIAKDLVPQVFLTVLYLTTTIILWWFGIRNRQGSRSNN